MKELKILIRQLKQWPDNMFAVPVVLTDTKHRPPHAPVHGINIINSEGLHCGFIDLGSGSGVVVD